MNPFPRILVLLLPLVMPIFGHAASTEIEEKYGGAAFSFKEMGEALEAASASTLAESLLIAGRLPGGGNQESILKAMEKRKQCDSTRATRARESDFACRSDPRSMRMLARQYARQEWLARDLLLGLAQAVLCASSSAVKRPKLPIPQDERILKAYEETVSVLFEDVSAVGKYCTLDELTRRMNGSGSSGLFGKEAKKQGLFSAIEKIHAVCGGTLVDSDQQRALQNALRYCSDQGANTDDKAVAMLKELEVEVEQAANKLMLRFLAYKSSKIPVSYQEEFPKRCLHGGWLDIAWNKRYPWMVEFSCAFGPTERWYFDPFADGGPQFSKSETLRENRFMGDYSALEIISRAWMEIYLNEVNARRQEGKNHCKRDSEGMKDVDLLYLDKGLSFELICTGDGRRVWRRAFHVFSEGTMPVVGNSRPSHESPH